MSSSLLPNSYSEWMRIAHDLSLDPDDSRVAIVPNGFDADASQGVVEGESPPDHLASFKDCVLCVARIEGRKNQLNLIDAVRGTDLTLVLAGPATANQSRYVHRVREAAMALDNVHILGKVTSEEKAWLYVLAGVHAAEVARRQWTRRAAAAGRAIVVHT